MGADSQVGLDIDEMDDEEDEEEEDEEEEEDDGTPYSELGDRNGY